MGKVSLEISSNISKLLGETTQLNENIKKLTTETDNYTKRSTDGFYKETLSVKQLNTEIKTQEKIIKDMERELEKMSKLQGKAAQDNSKAYKRLQGDIKIAKQELQGLNAAQQQSQVSASKGMAIFNKLGGIIAGAFSAYVVWNFIKTSYQAFAAQEAAEARLLTALKGRRAATKELIIQAKQLQKTTIFSDDDIINAQSLLAALVKNKNAIKELTPLVADFAAAKQIDLATAANIVSKAFGSNTNALSRYGIEVKGLAGSQERLRMLTDGLTRAFGGQAEAMGNTAFGASRRLNNSFGELKETFGAMLSSIGVTSMFQGLSQVFFETAEGIEAMKEAAADLSGMEKFRLIMRQILSMGRWDEIDLIIQQVKKLSEFVGPPESDIWADYYRSIGDVATLSNAELIKLQEEFAQFTTDEMTAEMTAEKNLIDNELKIRRKAFDEYTKQMQDKEAIDRLYGEFKLDFLRQDQEEEKKAYEAEQKRLEEQQKRVDALIKSLAKLTQAWRDEANVSDIPWDTGKFIKDMEDATKWAEDNPFWSSLGLTSDKEVSMITDNFNKVIDSVNQLLDAEINASDQTIDMYNNRIDEIQTSLDRELELKLEGLANDYEGQKEQLLKVQALRDAELKEKAKYVEEQRILNGVMQLASLVTAAAEVLASEADKGVMGIALALIAIAGIITGFLTFQSEAEAATAYETGGLLKGKKHSEGGIRIPGTNIEVEGDEYVTNRGSTQKYLPLLEAINKDDRDGMKIFFDRKFVNKMPQQKVSFDIDSSKKLGEIVRELKKGKAEITYGNGFIIERIGGYTKKINLN